jgi:hypothetical protein
MNPGEGRVFGSSVLHHTYVTPAMREDRACLEIRSLDARRPPSRLGGDCFARVP